MRSMRLVSSSVTDKDCRMMGVMSVGYTVLLYMSTKNSLLPIENNGLECSPRGGGSLPVRREEGLQLRDGR